MSVCVVTPDKKPLMPTSEYRARKLLKSGKAVIFKHKPFTIMLTRVIVDSKKHRAKGVQHNGMYVALDTGKSVSVKKVEKIIHAGGYMPVK